VRDWAVRNGLIDMTEKQPLPLLREETGRVLVIAHRGASGLRPENTLAAFRDALTEGADGLELDVRATADGELVVLHDKTVNRTTNGGGNVSGKTAAEVERLDAGSWFRSEFGNERVPLLRQVLNLTSDGVLLDLEIKEKPGNTLFLHRFVDLLREQDCTDRVVVTSMNPKVLKRLRDVDASLRLGPVVTGPYGADLFQSDFAALACSQEVVDKRCVRRAHERGIAVWVWTVNDLSRAAKFAELGVDGIITNYPGQVREVLRELGF